MQGLVEFRSGLGVRAAPNLISHEGAVPKDPADCSPPPDIFLRGKFQMHIRTAAVLPHIDTAALPW
jgi:hypothetical protein